METVEIALGAGLLKTVRDVERAVDLPVDVLTVGTFAVPARGGNSGVTYYQDGDGRVLNSLGLPNGGLAYLREHLPTMLTLCADQGKRLVLSIGGEGLGEWRELALVAAEFGVTELEVNLGCPNVWGEDGNQKKIASYDPYLAHTIVAQVHDVYRHGELSIKLSPLDPSLMVDVHRAVRPFATRLVVCNTYPNALLLDEHGSPRITGSPSGYAGLSGPALHAIALGQVAQHRALSPTLPITGIGGVHDGDGVQRMVAAGADRVGITTAAYQSFIPIPQIVRQYIDLCARAENVTAGVI